MTTTEATEYAYLIKEFVVVALASAMADGAASSAVTPRTAGGIDENAALFARECLWLNKIDETAAVVTLVSAWSGLAVWCRFGARSQQAAQDDWHVRWYDLSYDAQQRALP